MLREGANVGVYTREEEGNQHLRDRTLQAFRNSDFQFLIATNIIASGINVRYVSFILFVSFNLTIY